MYDLIIKNGTIVDGSGLPAFTADLAVNDGRVVKIGRIAGDARETLDATGKVVTPGFIDPHTHFDAQLLWDGFAKPALTHGVTTIVPGNCTLSLEPLKAKHQGWSTYFLYPRRILYLHQQSDPFYRAARWLIVDGEPAVSWMDPEYNKRIVYRSGPPGWRRCQPTCRHRRTPGRCWTVGR